MNLTHSFGIIDASSWYDVFAPVLAFVGLVGVAVAAFVLANRLNRRNE